MEKPETIAPHRPWAAFPDDYRADLVARLGRWIGAGRSGCVVGMGGAGKSNLLGFLADRPQAVDPYLPPGRRALVALLDLNGLPAFDGATLYRGIFRALHQHRGRLDPRLAAALDARFQELLPERDPFVAQTQLLRFLEELLAQPWQVALVLDRFDRLDQRAGPALAGGLRALRDQFKGRFSLIVGMRQAPDYLAAPAALGEVLEILDSSVLWVGPMGERDALGLLEREPPGPVAIDSDSARRLVALSGGYASLVKVAAIWWQQSQPGPDADWAAQLMARSDLRQRLDEIWEGLTPAEQAALGALARGDGGPAGPLLQQHRPGLERLAAKGLLEGEPGAWRVRGPLLQRHALAQAAVGGGELSLVDGEPVLGGRPLEDLSQLERSVLRYLLGRPRARVAKTELIEGIWPDEVVADGVMDGALYQVVCALRRKLEPEPARPRYLVTWRGRPEGGYQLFPEGRPGGGQEAGPA